MVRVSAHNILGLVQNSVFREAFPTIAHELLGETDLGNRFRASVFEPIRANTKARLERLYGARHGFAMRNAPEGGLEVSIDIPFRTI